MDIKGNNWYPRILKTSECILRRKERFKNKIPDEKLCRSFVRDYL